MIGHCYHNEINMKNIFITNTSRPTADEFGYAALH